MELPSRPYQDIVIGDVLHRGERDCLGRLNMILPVIPENAVVLDVGCNVGYFVTEIAKKRPDVLMIGIEQEERASSIAAHVAEQHGLTNCIILNSKLTLEFLQHWWNCTAAFDVALVLSVLHHFPPEEVATFIRHLRCNVFDFVIEFSPPDDIAGGGETRKKIGEPSEFIATQFEGCMSVKLGESTAYSPISNVKRPMYYVRDNLRVRHASKSCMMSNPEPRIVDDPYRQSTVAGPGHKYWIDYEAKTLRKRDGGPQPWLPGVNLYTMLKLNMIYPRREAVCKQAELLVESVRSGNIPYDLGCWNMVMTTTGLKIIDHMEGQDGLKYGQDRLDRLHDEILGLKELD